MTPIQNLPKPDVPQYGPTGPTGDGNEAPSSGGAPRSGKLGGLDIGLTETGAKPRPPKAQPPSLFGSLSDLVGKVRETFSGRPGTKELSRFLDRVAEYEAALKFADDARLVPREKERQLMALEQRLQTVVARGQALIEGGAEDAGLRALVAKAEAQLAIVESLRRDLAGGCAPARMSVRTMVEFRSLDPDVTRAQLEDLAALGIDYERLSSAFDDEWEAQWLQSEATGVPAPLVNAFEDRIAERRDEIWTTRDRSDRTLTHKGCEERVRSEDGDRLKQEVKASVLARILDGHLELATRWAEDAREHGMPAEVARTYFEARVPITGWSSGDALPVHDDSGRAVLGKGAMNTVYRVEDYRFSSGTLPDAEPLTVVVKPLDSRVMVRDLPGQFTGTGIPSNDPSLEGRNIASYRIDRMLKLDLTPPTELAKVDGELCIVMGMAPGTSPLKASTVTLTLTAEMVAELKKGGELLGQFKRLYGLNDALDLEFVDDVTVRGTRETYVQFDYGNGDLRRELTRLQWLDALTGQMDRHGHNYFIDVDENGVFRGLTSIDNDGSFGKALHDPDEAPGVPGSQNLGLPDVIDRDLADSLQRLTHDDLRNALEGLVGEDEILAACDRLDAIQRKVARLESSGGVTGMARGDWESDDVARRLSPHEGSSGSYAWRDGTQLSGAKDDPDRRKAAPTRGRS